MLCNKVWLEQAIPNSTIIGLATDKEIKLSVAVDSRTIQSGQFYLALKGARVDGHCFIKQAITNGAGGIIVTHEYAKNMPTTIKSNTVVIAVADTMQALISLAKKYRSELTMPIVGITGSVGKTSTKELLSSIFNAAGMNCFVSHKNQNTIIGLCMNILNVKKEHTYAAFELGINETGEMLELVDVARPTIALITTVAHAHAEKIGTLEDIAREKRTIFNFFSPHNIGIIFGDNPLLATVSYPHPIARFGSKTSNHVQARKIRIIETNNHKLETQFTLKWYDKKASVKISSHHRGMVYNALAAATIAYHLNIPFDAVVKGIESYKGTEGRFQHTIMNNQSGVLINDSCNANPESMKAALVAFDQLSSPGKKILVLGDMLELGEQSIYWHRRIGRFISKLSSIDGVILVGRLAHHMAYSIPTSISVNNAATWRDACDKLKEQTAPKNNLILVKASFGVQLVELVKAFSE